jgi:hypothetical protein
LNLGWFWHLRFFYKFWFWLPNLLCGRWLNLGWLRNLRKLWFGNGLRLIGRTTRFWLIDRFRIFRLLHKFWF